MQLTSWPTPPPPVARPLALQLAAVRAAYVLAPDPTLAWLTRPLYLSFDPPSYGDPLLPVPTTLQRLCLPRGPVAADGAAPAWLARRTRPLSYVTLGTTFNTTPGILETILAGGRDPAELGPHPPHVPVERYLPHAHVLPHCALVVAHGGTARASPPCARASRRCSSRWARTSPPTRSVRRPWGWRASWPRRG